MTEHVDHPRHYVAHSSGVEAIDLCEHLSFNAGNALKYVWRAEHKGRLREDLSKALWYVRRMHENEREGCGLPTALVGTARLVVNSEPPGSLLAVMIHQLALPAIIRDEHLENAEYALVRAIEGIIVHLGGGVVRLGETVSYRAMCETKDVGIEITDNDDEVTCPDCRMDIERDT